MNSLKGLNARQLTSAECASWESLGTAAAAAAPLRQLWGPSQSTDSYRQAETMLPEVYTVAENCSERGLSMQGMVCLAAAEPRQQSEAQRSGSRLGIPQLQILMTPAGPLAGQARHMERCAALNPCSTVLTHNHASTAVQELGAHSICSQHSGVDWVSITPAKCCMVCTGGFPVASLQPGASPTAAKLLPRNTQAALFSIWQVCWVLHTAARQGC